MKKRKEGDVINVATFRDRRDGKFYWFEGVSGAMPTPETPIYGPFDTMDECEENQRIELLGPQCKVTTVRRH
jgi:hypothetical protein